MGYWKMALLVVIAIGLAGPAFSGELVIPMENGWINWSARTLHARGTGVPSTDIARTPRARDEAFRKAGRQAYQNLLKTVTSMRLTSTMTVKDLVANKDYLLSNIEQMLNDARIESTRYHSDGTVEIVKRMPVTGALSQLILPESIVQLEMKRLGRETPDDNRIVYTGLVVDARGVILSPALCFKIVDEKLQEVYGPAYASREYAVQRGLCEYRTEISDIGTVDRIGKNPLIVRGLKAMETGGADIIISNTDASRVRSTVEHLFFLRECQVLVIVDPSVVVKAPSK